MEILARLRAETRREHTLVERTIVETGILDDRRAYLAYLRRMYGFHATTDVLLQRSDTLRAALDDLSERRKAAWLRDDLVALGHTHADVDGIDRLPLDTALEGPRALGWAYVLEGATLGGRVLAPRLRERLGLDTGLAFVTAYGADTDERWQCFRRALVRYAAMNDAATEIVTGAIAAFTAVHEWCVASDAAAADRSLP